MSISFFLHHFPPHLSSSLWADTHFPLSCLLLHHLCFLSPCCIFPLSTGSQLHAESLWITELQGTVSKILLHFLCMVLLFFFPEALGGDRLIRRLLFLFWNLFCELIVQLLLNYVCSFSVFVTDY